MKNTLPHYERRLPFGLTAGAAASPAAEVSRLIAAMMSAAETGDPDAQYRLGLACFHGVGVEKNLVTARRLQQAAAEQGVAAAQFELSLLLEQGLGGPADGRGARRWEQRAAKAGHPRACLNWASRLARARRPDFAAVARWYERAAEAGSAEAAVRLRQMHLAGQGVARDKSAARRWYVRAAVLGHDWSTDAARLPEVEG